MPRAKRTLSEGTSNAKPPTAKKSARVRNTSDSMANASASDASNTNATNGGPANTVSYARFPQFWWREKSIVFKLGHYGSQRTEVRHHPSSRLGHRRREEGERRGVGRG